MKALTCGFIYGRIGIKIDDGNGKVYDSLTDALTPYYVNYEQDSQEDMEYAKFAAKLK